MLFYLICDNIRSRENIGSIFRTAEALRIKKIFLCGITPCPPHSKISKAALGAENFVSWEYHKQTWRLIEKLKAEKIYIMALEQERKAVPFYKFNSNKIKNSFSGLALIIGNEKKGISPKILERADKIIYIPMFGKKESLNVAVAFGIAGYRICLSAKQF